MTIFQGVAFLISLTALFSYVNARFLRLPNTIAVMMIALVVSLVLVLFGGRATSAFASGFLGQLDFNALVLQGMLSFLLFAGALHVNLENLSRLKWPILLLATGGVVVSTFVVAILTVGLLWLLGLTIPFTYALIFGALISPTDPIAVLSILKQAGVSEETETLITGESLFNDGVGVVVFSVLLGLVGAHHTHGGGGGWGIARIFLQEAGGGIFLGLLFGYGAYYLLRSIDDYVTEVLLTLALVTGGYAVAQSLHTSGPLMAVVAGLFIGNRGRYFAMSDNTRERLDNFWELIDEILNALLFVLVGLEVLVLKFTLLSIEAALFIIPLVLIARFLSVGVPMTLFRLRYNFEPYTVRLMVWGGLRGGISIALALSLPPGGARDMILVMTYGVVAFSILVQGLTLGGLAKRQGAALPAEPVQG